MRRKKARGALPGAPHVAVTTEGCNHWIFSSTITSRLHTLFPLSQNTLFHWYLLPFPGRRIFNLPSIHYGIASSIICWLIRTYIDHKRSCDLGTYSCNVELLAWTMICLAKWYINSEPWENMCVKEKGDRGRLAPWLLQAKRLAMMMGKASEHEPGDKSGTTQTYNNQY